MTRTCTGCGAQAVGAGTLAKPPGWGFFWDQGNGLTARYVCGACAVKIRDLAQSIMAVTKCEFLHFSNLLMCGEAPR